MFTSKEIARVTGGELVGEDVTVSSVSTDTRTIERGALFVAVKGERFDGNDYIEQAAQNGAAAALSDKKERVPADIPVIYVEDSREAQLKLARRYRDKFDVKLCGVTGSVGKTSTKDMIYAVLSAKFRALKTEGNFNNDIGLPKTLFRLDEEYGAAVIEMGMSGRGEISALSRTAHPDIAVITNIGWCHIESLKTRENILAAKLEILDGMDGGSSPLVVCGDDEFLGKLTAERVGSHKLIKYGFGAENDIRAENVKHVDGGEEFSLIFKGRSYAAKVPAIGEHHILNALAAFAVGIELGMTAETIIPAFMRYESSGLRQKIEKRGNITVILDCYNASPTSMKSALNVLSSLEDGEGRKIAVLGDMLELGERSAELHAGLAEYSGLADAFYLYGSEMAALYKELLKKGVPAVHSEDKEELANKLLENIKSGDIILFKGSRGMKMEEIAEKTGDGV